MNRQIVFKDMGMKSRLKYCVYIIRCTRAKLKHTLKYKFNKRYRSASDKLRKAGWMQEYEAKMWD